MKKKLFALVCFLLTALLLAGCGESASGDNAKADGKKEKVKKSELGDYNVFFGGEVVEEEDKFVIKGKSNLLPGSRVVGEVWVSEDDLFADTTELVGDDGSFEIELEHHKFGEAEIFVRFDLVGVQDDPIKRHYGEKGQKLKGPFVYKHKKPYDDIYKKAEVKVSYSPDEENDLSLKAPEWEELPKDYGDPRVWIEVDDITEDGEFYYLKGRSNLLEGSKIRGSYGWNSDDTQILPDGTFNLKIEYKYSEDTNFVIEFSPSSSQWNEIEEAYGSNGQKLVGNLVKTNSSGSSQHIELEVPWSK